MKGHDKDASGRSNYLRLAAMAALSFVAMYVLMYAMVNSLPDVFANLNQGYMAGLMTAAMVLIELAVMGAMYGRKAWSLATAALAIVGVIAFVVLIRGQVAISDSEFLRSMIPTTVLRS